MTGFLSRLFGKGGQAGGSSKTGREEAYKGFRIRATPLREGQEWRLAGEIIADGQEAEPFQRADRFSNFETAEDFCLRKARQIIDERQQFSPS